MVTAFPRLQGLLLEKFSEYRIKNSSYSLRAFAKKLGVSPALVSQVLTGKRPISAKFASIIVDRLNIDPQSQHDLSVKQSVKSPWVELSIDQFRLIAEWQHFAILSLAETNGFRSDAKWVARRLGISPVLAATSIECLIRMGLMRRSKSGKLSVTGAQYHSSDGVPNVAARRALNEDLDFAKKSLDEDSLDRRDFTSITLAIDPAKMPRAKKLIREFRECFMKEIDSGKRSEVYKLCVQFFPLTKDVPTERTSE